MNYGHIAIVKGKNRIILTNALNAAYVNKMRTDLL